MKNELQKPKELHTNGKNALWKSNTLLKKCDQRNCDCSSEDFVKPGLSSLIRVDKMRVLKKGSKNTLKKKHNVTVDTSKKIVQVITTQLDRVTKVPGLSLADFVADDLGLEECKYFILKWSKELKRLKSRSKNHIDKVSYAERFRSYLEGLNISKDALVDPPLTEDQKDLLWWIHVLQSLPKSSVCQDESSRDELLDLYSQWKKGQLINMLPIMDFIMRTILDKRDSILKRKLQHRPTHM